MAEITLNILRRLQEHVRSLEGKIKELTEQRDSLAAELESRSHFNTQIDHKCNYPTPEMIIEYSATKLTGDTTPAKGQTGKLI